MTQPDLTRFLLIGLAVSGLAFASGCGEDSGGDDNTNNDEGPGPAMCERDPVEEPGQAENLAFGETQKGFICPQEDKDWYKIEMPSSDALLSVDLTLGSPISPVNLTYAVFPEFGEGEQPTAVAAPPADASPTELQYVHCVDPGTYLLIVRDNGDDAQDFRNEYTLDLTSRPDPDQQEPNNDIDSAAVLTSGSNTTGFIACRGDEDWYEITTGPNELLDISLQSAITTYEPTIKVYDSTGENLLFEESNLGGTTSETDIKEFEVLPGAGTYYLVVSDDDNAQASPEIPYMLTVNFVQDIDENEPNNDPETATAITGGTNSACGGSWTAWHTETGTVGSPGDTDWYAVPLAAGCDGGILEAEVVYDTAGLSVTQQWELNSKVQLTLDVLRSHGPSACDDDDICSTLSAPCNSGSSFEFGLNAACAGISNQCLADQEVCAGATVCMPDNSCGAIVAQARYECPGTVANCQAGSGATPPPNRARIAVPITDQNVLFLRVSDFQSNNAEPDVPYTIRVRTRGDTDGGREPDNVFWATLPVETYPVDNSAATPITLGCGSMTTGALGYRNDVDWFTFAHPCPGSDCTLRVQIDIDGGPVDHLVEIYQGSNDFITVHPPRDNNGELGDNVAAVSRSVGGTSANSQCVYAFQGHSNPYYIAIRDIGEFWPDTTMIRQTSRDWDADQTYRFCVEVASMSCAEPPCMLHESGCGPP